MIELTPREYEAVLLMAQGQTTVEMAERMGISVQTAKNHLASANKRNGARNGRHLVWLAGWVSPTPRPDRHEPGDFHQYRATCEVCGQDGTLRITIEPQVVERVR